MKPSKNKNTKTQTIKTRKTTDIKLSKISIIIGIVVFIGATSPFWHMWFDKDSREEFIGFTNFRRFLAAFGINFALFCCASFIFWTKNFIDPQYKKVIKIVNVIGGIFVATGAYFLLWVFNPHSDFPKYVYNIAFAVSGIFVAYGMYLLNKFIVRNIFENRYKIKNLTTFIFRVRNKYFFPMAFNAINKDNREKIEEDIEKFDEEVFETLEEL